MFRFCAPALLLVGLAALSMPSLASPEGQGEGVASQAPEARYREAAKLRGTAIALMEEGSWDEAIAALRRLDALLPGNLLPPINLAICYLQSGRIEEAEEQIERARELDPDNAQMLFTAATLLENDPALEGRWREVVDHFARAHPGDPRPPYLLSRGETDVHAAIADLEKALRLSPDTLPLMVDLLVKAAEASEGERVVDALYAIEDRLNGFEGPLVERTEALHTVAEEGGEGLLLQARMISNLLLTDPIYQEGLQQLQGGRLELFPQLEFQPPLPPSIGGGQDIEIAWVEATGDFGLARLEKVTHLLPAGRPGEEWILAQAAEGPTELELGASSSLRDLGISGPVDLALSTSFDVDFDAVPDLVVVEPGRGIFVRLGEVADEHRAYGAAQEIGAAAFARSVVGLFPLDIDHDGDLDLFVARAEAEDLYFRNNGDGSWVEMAGDLGLAGGAETTTQILAFDLEYDGDLDLLVLHPQTQPRLLLNQRMTSFTDGTAERGLAGLPVGLREARVEDFDHNGRLDLLLFGEAGGQLLLNQGHAFEAAPLPPELATGWQHAETDDWDNDGDQDLVVATGEPTRLHFVRNLRGSFRVEEIGFAAPDLAQIVARDLDGDGDLDLLLRHEGGGLALWRNQGGNENHWLRLSFVGKNINNAKNNTQGLFTRIEVQTGRHAQVVVGNGAVNHLGLGSARSSELVRVTWTNAVVQEWHVVAADQTLVEENVLKGSCPFLYTWNGQEFEFVTDLMWRSPLGMVLADGRSAPHQSARDFVLVPGESLQAVDGELWLQITEELWEIAYVDRQILIAADHPAELELVVDERLLPPPYSREAPAHLIGDRLLPVAARDHEGRDQLSKILERDGQHVDDLPLGRYQGLTHGQRLDLTFQGVPADEALRLVLWGWTFPTDTSINVALSQDASRQPEGPSLDVLEPNGRWRRISEFIGFPNGKRKTMVVALPDDLPSGEVTFRIAGNLQVYWDAAALAVGTPPQALRLTELDPVAADLHFRGFSELYRETGTGPHLFDYQKVSTRSRFLPMVGPATRYGEVRELLTAGDNRSALLAAGDEMTVHYDASALPELPPGWRRDYILFTDGWVKDGDLNTEQSRTVGPLPFHGMRGYPDADGRRLENDPAYGSYLERYQVRDIHGFEGP